MIETLMGLSDQTAAAEEGPSLSLNKASLLLYMDLNSLVVFEGFCNMGVTFGGSSGIPQASRPRPLSIEPLASW